MVLNSDVLDSLGNQAQLFHQVDTQLTEERDMHSNNNVHIPLSEDEYMDNDPGTELQVNKNMARGESTLGALPINFQSASPENFQSFNRSRQDHTDTVILPLGGSATDAHSTTTTIY